MIKGAVPAPPATGGSSGFGIFILILTIAAAAFFLMNESAFKFMNKLFGLTDSEPKQVIPTKVEGETESDTKGKSLEELKVSLLEKYMDNLWNNEASRKSIAQKAKANNLTNREQLRYDALWAIEADYNNFKIG